MLARTWSCPAESRRRLGFRGFSVDWKQDLIFSVDSQFDSLRRRAYRLSSVGECSGTIFDLVSCVVGIFRAGSSSRGSCIHWSVCAARELFISRMPTDIRSHTWPCFSGHQQSFETSNDSNQLESEMGFRAKSNMFFSPVFVEMVHAAGLC